MPARRRRPRDVRRCRIKARADAGFTVTNVHLEVPATVPGAAEAAFQETAANAKKGCPISRLLNTEITMNARLEP